MPTNVLDLLLESPRPVVLAGVVIVLAAGFVQGLTGLGFAAVFTPLFVVIVPRPHEVVLLSLMLGAMLSLGVLAGSRHSLQKRRSWPLVAGGIIGTPGGIGILAVLDARVLMLVIGVLAIVIALVGIVRLPNSFRREPQAVAIAGLLGGFLNGSTSMGGSPPALLAAIQGWPVPQSRAALVAFNLVSYLLALTTGLITGVACPACVLSGLWLLPLAVIGAVLGTLASPCLSRAVFGRALMVVTGMSGVVGLLSALSM